MADKKTPAGVLAPKTAPLMPGLDNPENVKRANEALARRDAADYQCYMLLRALVEQHVEAQAFIEFISLRAGGMEDVADTEVGESWYEEAVAVLKDRRDANTSFLAAVAGQPEP